MLFAFLLMAVAVCIYWDWEEHAPEKVCPERREELRVPLSASVRKYEPREKRVAS